MSIPVSREMLERYNVAGPRYTSYPTVPVWTSAFSESDYERALRALAARADEPLSVYFHIPFCRSKCLYCGCNSAALGDDSEIDVYLDHVRQELELISGLLGADRRIRRMHWGGGTPNALDDRRLGRAFSLMSRTFRIDPDCEVSLEADPRVGSKQQINALKALGFNRISLGVQDLDPGVQKAIGRIQPEERTRALYHAAREADFTSVNLDLVYGLPGQTKKTFEKTLQSVIDLGPDRVACFSYAHVPWVKPNQKKMDESKLPGPFDKFELFRTAIDLFEGAGYTWIGLDHFAKEDDELSRALKERRLNRNFMGYTTRPELSMLAIGMSGISDLEECFAQNSSDLKIYRETVASGRLPVVRGHELTQDDRIRRQAIVHLMCNLELPFDLSLPGTSERIDRILPAAIERLKRYEAAGFIEAQENGLKVTGLGRYFIRNLCMELDAYLDGNEDTPLFSKTV